MATAINAPRPTPGESQEDYTVRAHRELMAVVPDPMQRNQVVWDAWDATHGNPDRERAEMHFAPEQFEHRRNVCLWHEHETVTRDPSTGEDVIKRNDIERIKAIVRENNLRIADTDSYSAIVDKHTLPSGKRDPIPPRTIGFAGPYRIGMIGRITPKFALFGDEHRRRDEAHTFRDRPRRSVEVLTLRANGRSYIDPIAALSEAPRLPLPVQYGFDGEDGHRDIYEAVAAFPGGNTFIPGGSDKEKDRYDTESIPGSSPPQNPREKAKPMALQPEDITQILEAIQSTPQFQFLIEMMAQAGGPAGGGDGSPVGAGMPMPGGSPQPPAPGAGGFPQSAGMGPPAMGQQPQGEEEKFACGPKYGAGSMPAGGMGGMAAQYMTNRFAAGEGDEMSSEQYQAIQGELESVTEHYQALAADHRQLMQEHAALKRGFAEVRMREVDANRRNQIRELASQYPHFIDSDREESKCLYSAGSEMTDEDFDSHLEDLSHYAAKNPAPSGMIPQGVFPERSRSFETERYEAEVTSRSVEIYTEALAAGRKLTNSEARKLAIEEIGR
jgi:hypothetical protein